MKKVDNYLYTHPKTLTALTVISFLGGVSLGIYHSLKRRKKKGSLYSSSSFRKFYNS